MRLRKIPGSYLNLVNVHFEIPMGFLSFSGRMSKWYLRVQEPHSEMLKYIFTVHINFVHLFMSFFKFSASRDATPSSLEGA
jgi:hypothetical protein